MTTINLDSKRKVRTKALATPRDWQRVSVATLKAAEEHRRWGDYETYRRLNELARVFAGVKDAFTRTTWLPNETHATVEIKTTFQWDAGDPRVGINPGWGDETGAEIIVPLGENRLITFIKWQECDQDGKPIEDPADWIITDLSVEYDHGSPVGPLPLVGTCSQSPVLTLRVLPEVLEAVTDAWQDVKAAERLTAAQEAVYELEAYADDLAHSHESGARLLLVQAQEDLGAARWELSEARKHARERGVRDE